MIPSLHGIFAATPTPFVGALDTLVSQGATVLFAGSMQRLLTSYTGNAMQLQGDGSGTPTADIPFLANGDLDTAAAAAAAAAGGGTLASGLTWYDQTGQSNATQSTFASQPNFSAAVDTKGAWGNGTAKTSCFILNLGTLSFPAYIHAVARCSTSGTRALLGTTASSSNRFCRTSTGTMQQNWGATLGGGTPGDQSAVLGFLANTLTSANFINGVQQATGDTSGSSSLMTSGRIGRSGLTTSTDWLNDSSTRLNEFIVFSGDPTLLAGWNDFITNRKSYWNIL